MPNIMQIVILSQLSHFFQPVQRSQQPAQQLQQPAQQPQQPTQHLVTLF